MTDDEIPGLHLHQGASPTGSVDALAAGGFGSKTHNTRPPKLPSIYGARPYQLEGIAWMIQTLQQYGGCILADEMGLGKTFQTIQVLRHSMAGRALILCPGSVRETWRDELLKWGFKPSEIIILYPGFKYTEAASKVVVCSYHHDMIDRAVKTFFSGEYPEFLIMDEAHRIRGRKTKRSNVLDEIRSMIPYKIALTGTPQWNSMKDWWQLLHILFGNAFGSKWNFDRRYTGAKVGTHGGLEYPHKEDKNITPKILHSEELKLRLSFYMLGRQKAQVAKDLPPMTVSIRWVDGTSEAKRALQKMHLNVGKGSVYEAIVATLKGKVDEVLTLAAEAGRFILTTWTNAGAAELHRMLNEAGTSCVLATAAMSGPRRAEAIKEATSRGCGLVATTDLFAEGLNLQHVASKGILHALDFNPSKMAQLFNRLHRVDTVAPVDWTVVAMKDSVDQYIIDAGVFKLESIQAVMGSGKHKELKQALNRGTNATDERRALANVYAAMEARSDGNQEDY